MLIRMDKKEDNLSRGLLIASRLMFVVFELSGSFTTNDDL